MRALPGRFGEEEPRSRSMRPETHEQIGGGNRFTEQRFSRTQAQSR